MNLRPQKAASTLPRRSRLKFDNDLRCNSVRSHGLWTKPGHLVRKASRPTLARSGPAHRTGARARSTGSPPAPSPRRRVRARDGRIFLAAWALISGNYDSTRRGVLLSGYPPALFSFKVLQSDASGFLGEKVKCQRRGARSVF